MEIIVLTTPSELLDRGVWIEACGMLGINEWAVNEGLMDGDHEIRLTQQQAEELRLLPRRESDADVHRWW